MPARGADATAATDQPPPLHTQALHGSNTTPVLAASPGAARASPSRAASAAPDSSGAVRPRRMASGTAAGDARSSDGCRGGKGARGPAAGATAAQAPHGVSRNNAAASANRPATATPAHWERERSVDLSPAIAALRGNAEIGHQAKYSTGP
eukprot:scaffold6650_cov110-Isochrysis_galbana.AAC.1